MGAGVAFTAGAVVFAAACVVERKTCPVAVDFSDAGSLGDLPSAAAIGLAAPGPVSAPWDSCATCPSGAICWGD